MKEAGIGYGAINHPVDRDPVCGYTGIIGEVCPRCGRREGEGVPLSKLQKLGLYKNYNSTTIGYHGDPAEEADRQPNTLKIVKKYRQRQRKVGKRCLSWRTIRISLHRSR